MEKASHVPLIVHLIYRLDFGGLENLLVERINRMPADKYRHAIVCLTDYTDFSRKITKPGVEIHALHKPPGLGLATHYALWKLLRRLKPVILHGYNLAAVEYAPAAMLAGVPIRINGSHGRDASDPEGRNPKHKLLRRLLIPFYDCLYSNSIDLLEWNRDVIGVPQAKSHFLRNGIDSERFRPAEDGEQVPVLTPFPADCIVIGTVGRAQDVKNHAALVEAFVLLRKMLPEKAPRLRLVIVGGGPLLDSLSQQAAAAGIAEAVWLPGARNDIPAILRSFSIFALPSIAEGTPGSVLEAMSTALPVVATRVGGVPAVVEEGVTGMLVPPSDPQAMAQALARYIEQPQLAKQHGLAGRVRVERQFNMQAMVAGYLQLYDTLYAAKIQGVQRPCVE
ncbi:MAG: TIGR03088 family PEP-CTERM/XrtA system glycosyltransferase [Burkholderiaceae bacterium]|nr:TIGR03088 family PEP-CTERM/XrtA system glycosyltransferase [Burkholderiaceae bacterium]